MSLHINNYNNLFCLVIIQPPQNQTGCEGGTVNFVCVVMFTSGPLGPASWFGSSRRPGYSLTDDSNGRSAPANVTNVLTVPNVSIRDNGDDFICEQQGINAMSFTAFLTVIGE